MMRPMTHHGRVTAAAVPGRAIAAAVAAVAIAATAIGCSTATRDSSTESAGGVSTASTTQMCAGCNSDSAPPKTVGTARMEGAVQVVEIGVKDGYYVPNEIQVRAGVPTRVIFKGDAKGCLAKPRFPALGKKADFSGSDATLDLGRLAAGSYTFTCAMGKNAGTLVVR